MTLRSITSAALAAAVAGALALSAVQIASAQDQSGDRHACMRDAFSKLNLTDDQKSKLQDLRASGQKGPDRRAAMQKILSPEQLAQLRDARKACGGGDRQG